MDTNKIYDIIGIGIGPFNLGLAALASEIPSLDCIFIDKKLEFNWHPGMLLPTAKMQVPFYADLVTPVSPGNRFSYFHFLKAMNRTIPFAILEDNYPYRTEYNEYCKWVAGQLESLHFGYECSNIIYDRKKKMYTVFALNQKGEKQLINGRHIVIGVGSEPDIPACLADVNHPNVFHSGEYLFKKNTALMHKRITLIGSGQSAGEIFLDLLQHKGNWQQLHWYTRADRFHPMDDSKLTLELSSPTYIDYFYSLDPICKERIVTNQQYLYKGMNRQLIEEIYRNLYLLSLKKSDHLPRVFVNSELQSIRVGIKQRLHLQFAQRETGQLFDHETGTVVLATGYRDVAPEFLLGIKDKIRRLPSGKYEISKNYAVDENNSVFVQNADLHTHGFTSADLGLGVYRNATIVNSIVKSRRFATEVGYIFQSFVREISPMSRRRKK